MCMCLARSGVGGEGIGFEIYQSCGNRGSVGRGFGLRWCKWVVGRVLGPGSGGLGLCYVVSPDYLCGWQVQVSVYCAWQIHAHLRCTQCSILLHIMDICFLPCNYLWQISQIHTFFVCGCRTWICFDITRFYEERRQLASWFVWPACPKNR